MLANIFKTLAVALPLAVAAPSLFAQTFAGKLNGLGCAEGGKSCPTSRLDPHLALEPDFVLMQSEKDYLFLPNLSHSTKARYALETVQVEGTLNPRYQTVMVSEFKVKEGDKFVTKWSEADQEKERQYLYHEKWFQHN
jgi:hypothetical protein